MSNNPLFGSASHFANMGSWKAGSPVSNPLWLKAQSRQFFIASVVLVAWKHGANTERCHNKWPWRPQTKKSKRNFTVTGISCLDQARTANFGYRKFMKIYGQISFESITDFNLIIEPDDVRAGLWLPTQYCTLTDSLISSWVDKHVEQISFRQWVTFSEHGQLKGWQPHFEPIIAKHSISTILHCFGGFCCMETWGRLLQDATTNGLGDHKPKNLIETSLWQAWVWVAWIEEGQQIVATEYLRRKIIRMIHNSNFNPDVRAGLWLPTQYFTVTDSLISSWVECLC